MDVPIDLTARTDMLAAAAMAGRSLQNATMRVYHGLAQLIGGKTGMSHGLANAVILAHSVRFNAEAVADDVRRIGAVLGDADNAPEAIARVVTRLGLPGRLSACGVAEDDLDAVAAYAPASPSVAANPRPVTEANARAILAAAY